MISQGVFRYFLPPSLCPFSQAKEVIESVVVLQQLGSLNPRHPWNLLDNVGSPIAPTVDRVDVL